MKRLHTFDVGDNVQLAVLQSILESHSIPCLARNENMFGAAGGVPFTECYPELWVLQDDDLAAAIEIRDSWLATPKNRQDSWTCERCGEDNGAQFQFCWHCGWTNAERHPKA